MPRFEIAHLHEQGQDMIIVPLADSFGSKSQAEQGEIAAELQIRARSAGLKGKVVPVWGSRHSMNFIAPQLWHPFFRSIDWSFIARNINRVLSW